MKNRKSPVLSSPDCYKFSIGPQFVELIDNQIGAKTVKTVFDEKKFTMIHPVIIIHNKL